MKSNAFGERTRLLAEWFQDWNSCEQTIALYSLLSRVSATQARFLSLVLEHTLKTGCDSQELHKMERQANDAGAAPESACVCARVFVIVGLLLSGLAWVNRRSGKR